MRRSTAALGLLVVTVATVVAIAAFTSSGSPPFRFAAVFDDARGMVAGQQVKIAGAVVGTVSAVDLQVDPADPKARIVMSIERRFAPLSADTTCTILPSGLISENYVQCAPGHAPSPLATGPGGLPTVPLKHTTVPFSLQDVLNVFSLPTDQRLGLLISELGIATAGRGADVNALLRRADPALTQSRRVLAILSAQRRSLAAAVGQTDRVVARLASRDGQVRRFVDDAARVAQTTGRHAASLGASVHRLPAMLAAVRPGLRSLAVAAANATPLLDELHASAGGLLRLTTVLPSFTRAGLPAVRTLAAATRSGIPAVAAATPVIAKLLATSAPLKTLATGLDQLLVSSRDTGALEGTLRTAYAFANNTSLYDGVSHILTFMASVSPTCIAGQQGGVSVPGCAHAYTAPEQGQIPVNEPSCGAKSAQWWNQTCPIANPGPIAGLSRQAASPAGQAKLGQLQGLVNQALAGRSAPPQSFRSLLDFLLK
jgi:ABC-type transporter Mla subunit MlaD